MMARTTFPVTWTVSLALATGMVLLGCSRGGGAEAEEREQESGGEYEDRREDYGGEVGRKIQEYEGVESDDR